MCLLGVEEMGVGAQVLGSMAWMSRCRGTGASTRMMRTAWQSLFSRLFRYKVAAGDRRLKITIFIGPWRAWFNFNVVDILTSFLCITCKIPVYPFLSLGEVCCNNAIASTFFWMAVRLEKLLTFLLPSVTAPPRFQTFSKLQI